MALRFLNDDFRTPARICSAAFSEWLTSARTYSEFGISANICSFRAVRKERADLLTAFGPAPEFRPDPNARPVSICPSGKADGMDGSAPPQPSRNAAAAPDQRCIFIFIDNEIKRQVIPERRALFRNCADLRLTTVPA